MINAILHIRKDLMLQLRGFKANPDAVGGGNLKILAAINNMLDSEGELGWWKNSGAVGDYFIPVDLLLTEDQFADLLNFGGVRINVLRVLNQDGTDYGQEFDDEDNEITSPIYPDVTASILGDKAVRDNEGTQIGTAPMVFNEMPQWLGWERLS